MAAEKVDVREVSFRQLFPWTELFRGFQVALDPKKLLLAAGGLLVMAIGWWLLAEIFLRSRTEPQWGSGAYRPAGGASMETAWAEFKADRNKWNLLYETAGDQPVEMMPEDLAKTYEEYGVISKAFNEGQREFVIGDRVLRIEP